MLLCHIQWLRSYWYISQNKKAKTNKNKKTFSQKNKNKMKQLTLFAAKKVFLGENHHLNSLLFCPLPAVQGDSENSDWLSEDQKPRGIMLHPCTGVNTTGSDLGVRNVFVCARVWVKTRRGLQRGVRAPFEEKSFSQKPAWEGLEGATPRQRHRRSRLRMLSASADTNPPPSPLDGRGPVERQAEWKTDTLMHTCVCIQRRIHTHTHEATRPQGGFAPVESLSACVFERLLPSLECPKQKTQPSAPFNTDWITSATVPAHTSA